MHIGLLRALAIFVALATSSASVAQDAEPQPPTVAAAEPVKVGLYLSPPFVMEKDGAYAGLAIDLWEAFSDSAGLESDYQVFPTVRELVLATAAADIDVAVTNLTITRRRAETVDFTHPWFDAGMRIMVDDDRTTSFGDVWDGLRDSGFLRAYAWLAFVIVVATLLVTLFDRRFDKSFPTRWRDGVAESFYTVMSVTTSGKPPSRKNLFGWVGRIWSAFWLVCGIAVFAYITSSVTSVMTTISLTNQINSLDDLPGQTVGVLAGGVSQDYAEEQGLAHIEYDSTDDEVAALLRGEVAALIGDAPVLEYYAHTHPEDTVSVVGAIFEPDKYGFALPPGSPLTKQLSLEIIGASESGALDDFSSRYFGDQP